MTGRTHDLAAFTALTAAFAYLPLTQMSLATLFTAIGANFVGGLAPDLDNSTASLWKQIRGGTFIGKILAPVLGGHRLISHSLVGLFLTGFILEKILQALGTILLVDMSVVWDAFMIGMISHLFMDMLTKEGIPLLFPLPWNIGIPPLASLRIKTGGLIEKSIIYPGLMILTGYLMYLHYAKILDFFRHYIV